MHSWQAALEAASRTVLRCTLLNGHLLNHYPSQKPNFFEVACSIQKVVEFKGRINVQLPPAGMHSWQAALEAASSTVLRCTTLLNGQLLNHYPSQKPHFFEVACSIQKVVKFKGWINVQLPLLVSDENFDEQERIVDHELDMTRDSQPVVALS